MAALFSATIPILRMFDVAKARDFYLDFLGFKVDFEHRFAPDLPLYMQVSQGDARLHLSEHYGDGTPGTRVIIEMTGIADYQAKLIAKQHGYARPGLERQDWSATTMTIHDPFHNALIFAERDVSPSP